MSRYECEASYTTVVRKSVNAADRYEAGKAYRRKTGRWPESVGDDIVLAICEACERPLFEGDKYSSDSEGIHVCAACCPEPEKAA